MIEDSMYKVIYEVTAFVRANDKLEAIEKAKTNLNNATCDLGIIAELKSVTWHNPVESFTEVGE